MAKAKFTYTTAVPIKRLDLSIHQGDSAYVVTLRANGYVWRGEGRTAGAAIGAVLADLKAEPRGLRRGRPSNRYKTAVSLC